MIVMLCNLTRIGGDGKSKEQCFKYWPSLSAPGALLETSEFLIENRGEVEILDEITQRTFFLKALARAPLLTSPRKKPLPLLRLMVNLMEI